MQVHKITDIDGETLQHAPCAGGLDFTLCGFTLDGDPDCIKHQEIVTGKITCPQCRAIIIHCKTLKL